MGCGCGKKFSSSSGNRSVATASSPVPAQVQKGTFTSDARVVKSQQTPYRNGLTIQRRVV